MSDHLDKAKAALEHARDLGPGDLAYHDLLRIVEVQAQVAQADAMERIAGCLESLAAPVFLLTEPTGPPEPEAAPCGR